MKLTSRMSHYIGPLYSKNITTGFGLYIFASTLLMKQKDEYRLELKTEAILFPNQKSKEGII